MTREEWLKLEMTKEEMRKIRITVKEAIMEVRINGCDCTGEDSLIVGLKMTRSLFNEIMETK